MFFDVYHRQSRKRQTRESRGKKEAVRLAIKTTTPVYKKFNEVMAVDENKTELFELIATELATMSTVSENTIVLTHGERVLSNKEIEKGRLEPCRKEEADERMFLHAIELVRKGLKRITILTVDTDVVVIALNSFWDMRDVEELWIEFGRGKDRKWIPIHLNAYTIGKEMCRAIIFRYALTGCDTVTQLV